MKKTILFIFGIMSIISGSLFAQPAIEWQHSIGGSGGDLGKGLCIAKDSLAYYVVGYTNSANGNIIINHGGFDIFLSKMGLNGNIIWTKTYGAASNDYAQCIIPTHDNGILICGFTSDSLMPGTHGGFDVLLIKVDSAGNQLWMNFYGGSKNEGDLFSDIVETPDKGFACVTGSVSNNGDINANYGSSDFWMFKIDSLGNLKWTKNFGGTDDEDGHTLLSMPDGGFILAGHTASNNMDVSGQHNPNSGIHDGWVVRIDSSHNIKWQKCIGGTDSEFLNKMCFDNIGNIVIVGYTASTDGDISGNHGMHDVWIAKMDTASGNLLSSKLFGGSGDDYGYYLLQNADGTFIYSGYSSSIDGDVSGNHGNFDYWIWQADLQGNIIWENSYGGSNNDRNTGICQAIGNGIIINGYSNSTNGDVLGNQGFNDCWLARLSCKKPTADFTSFPNPSCMGDSIHFTNTSSGALTYQWYLNGTPLTNTTNASTVFNVPGLDSIVLVSNFENCSDTVRQIVTINSVPIVSLGNDTIICQGCNIVLDAGNDGATFLWSTGEQTQNITVSSTDTIWVIVDMNACLAIDTIIITIDQSIGIGNVRSNGFSVYPNPTSGLFRINLDIAEEYYLDILQPDSRIVSSTGPYKGNVTVQLDLPASGCYLAVIKNCESKAIEKILLFYNNY